MLTAQLVIPQLARGSNSPAVDATARGDLNIVGVVIPMCSDDAKLDARVNCLPSGRLLHYWVRRGGPDG